ncbi:hypothetical protein I4U23_013036 [Adineta vaga]|nr:hypothetical protein I4U23_013036 [Adineta vaga]
MKSTSILINCTSLFLHILSIIVTFVFLILLIYRLYFNCIYRRHSDAIIPSSSSSPFDDNISLILILNTHFICLIYSIVWIPMIMRTFAGDFSLFKDFLYFGDSNICRAQVGIIFFLTTQLYHSILLQALYRYIRIDAILKTDRKLLRTVWFYILLIVCSWLIALLVLIPPYTIIDVFSYFPELHHCMISFSNIRGFIYSLLVAYLLPMNSILYMYFRVILNVRSLSKRSLLIRTKRDVIVIKRIVCICVTIGILGFPTLFFLFQFIITGRIHPLADRIHELCLSIGILGFTSGFATLNSLINILPRRSSVFYTQNEMMVMKKDSS